MSPLRNIMLAVCLAVAFGAASDPTFPAPKQPDAYIPDKEMSFEMNSSTGFVRVPSSITGSRNTRSVPTTSPCPPGASA